MEGVAFELRLHLDGLEAVTGTRVDVLRAMGGGSRSPLWTRIVADVTGRPVRLCDGEEISARGAGVLAWAGAVPGADVASAAARMVALGETIAPRPERTARYERLFAVQRQVYPSLRGVFAELAAAQA
jgi:xylulokinase